MFRCRNRPEEIITLIFTNGCLSVRKFLVNLSMLVGSTSMIICPCPLLGYGDPLQPDRAPVYHDVRRHRHVHGSGSTVGRGLRFLPNDLKVQAE